MAAALPVSGQTDSRAPAVPASQQERDADEDACRSSGRQADGEGSQHPRDDVILRAFICDVPSGGDVIRALERCSSSSTRLWGVFWLPLSGVYPFRIEISLALCSWRNVPIYFLFLGGGGGWFLPAAFFK